MARHLNSLVYAFYGPSFSLTPLSLGKCTAVSTTTFLSLLRPASLPRIQGRRRLVLFLIPRLGVRSQTLPRAMYVYMVIYIYINVYIDISICIQRRCRILNELINASFCEFGDKFNRARRQTGRHVREPPGTNGFRFDDPFFNSAIRFLLPFIYLFNRPAGQSLSCHAVDSRCASYFIIFSF